MIMKLMAASAAAILFASPLAFACDYPPRADLPDGTSASTDDMLAGQKSVKAFMASMEEYLVCIEKEEKEAVAALVEPGDEELARRKAAVTKKYNAAVEDMELIAAKFNEQVRAYKAQNQ
jgi:hypothetical protein